MQAVRPELGGSVFQQSRPLAPSQRAPQAEENIELVWFEQKHLIRLLLPKKDLKDPGEISLHCLGKLSVICPQGNPRSLWPGPRPTAPLPPGLSLEANVSGVPGEPSGQRGHWRSGLPTEAWLLAKEASLPNRPVVSNLVALCEGVGRFWQEGVKWDYKPGRLSAATAGCDGKLQFNGQLYLYGISGIGCFQQLNWHCLQEFFEEVGELTGS